MTKNVKLNPNVELWCDLLESGELPQSRKSLQTNKGYCCLGVACIAYERATGEKLYRREPNGQLTGGVLREHYTKVKKWLGLSTKSGDYGEGNERSLTLLNDQDKLTFPEIAAIIRSNPEGLFE